MKRRELAGTSICYYLLLDSRGHMTKASAAMIYIPGNGNQLTLPSVLLVKRLQPGNRKSNLDTILSSLFYLHHI